MKIEIEVVYYKEYDILRKLVDELKTKKATIIEEKRFWINLELTINSFDEIIPLLEKYNSEIEITLYVYSNKVKLFMSIRDTCSLGNQVE